VNTVNETRQEVQAVRRIDFVVRDEGTIWLFTPSTSLALQFLSEHIQDDAQYFGDSLVVEHRYVGDLLLGLSEHGLEAVRS
jgi:hypothetical protein